MMMSCVLLLNVQVIEAFISKWAEMVCFNDYATVLKNLELEFGVIFFYGFVVMILIGIV